MLIHRHSNLFALVLLALFAALLQNPPMVRAQGKNQTYRLVPGEGQLLVFTESSGLLSYLGHSLTLEVKDYSGKIVLDPQAPEKSSLEVKVRADSLEVTDRLKPKDIREIRHNMNEKVLKTDRFPEIHFLSTAVRVAQGKEGKLDLRIDGNLTLCGVTRPTTISAEVQPGENRLQAKGEFIVKQKDFKIKPYSALAGGIRVKNEVTVFFNLSAKP
jgi:polyisoprenoid-binding protein YceI